VLKKGTIAYFDIVSSFEGRAAISLCQQRLEAAAKQGIASLFEEEKAAWAAFWSESTLKVPDPAFQREFDLASYFLFAGAKRGCPPLPLQGLWTSDEGTLPPWKGDYHNDLNTQMTYASALRANHLEEFAAYTDFLFSEKAEFERVAHDFYGVKGLLIPGVADFLGRPLGGWPMYAFSPAMSIWAVKVFDDYFRLTGDRAFFEKEAVPMMTETGEAILGLLQEKDEKYYLPLSSSPEIHDNTPAAYLKPISNNDLALLRYLFSTLVSYATLQEKDPARYQKVLDHLSGFYQAPDGSFLLDAEEKLAESHRHFSHLLAFYPLQESTDKKALAASLAQLEKLGTGQWVGFSYVWEALLAERAGEKELAYRRLSEFLDGFLSPNGFHLNGDYQNKGYSDFKYRPFTLEAVFGYQAAVEDMLFWQEGDAVSLFAALPNAWKNASFKNFRGAGGLLWDAKVQSGKIISLSVDAPREATLRILPNPRVGLAATSLHLKKGKNVIL
jgi:alpha-L-fucosidase 2